MQTLVKPKVDTGIKELEDMLNVDFNIREAILGSKENYFPSLSRELVKQYRDYSMGKNGNVFETVLNEYIKNEEYADFRQDLETARNAIYEENNPEKSIQSFYKSLIR